MHLKKKDGGYALVTVALLLVVMVAFVSLAVDLGIAYSARAAAQRTADSAALAGAFTFVIDTYPDETDIKNRAVEQAAANSILGSAVSITPGDVTVDMVNRRVTVNVERTQARGNPIPTYFSQLFRSSIDVRVEAVAEASTVANADGCTKPWIIPSTAFSPPGLTPCEACETNQVLIRNGAVTPWAEANLFADGAQAVQYMIKPQSPHDSLVPSNFYAIETGLGSGAAIYRESISGCADTITECGDTFQVEPGNMTGPTDTGVDDLLGANPHTYALVSGEHRFERSGHYYDTSHQLAVSPIWDACDDPLFQTDVGGKGGCECPAECVAPGNNTWYTIDGYAQIFVEGMGNIGGGKGDGVIVRLIGLKGCGASSVASGEAGPLSVPIRLVRVPSSG